MQYDHKSVSKSSISFQIVPYATLAQLVPHRISLTLPVPVIMGIQATAPSAKISMSV